MGDNLNNHQNSCLEISWIVSKSTRTKTMRTQNVPKASDGLKWIFAFSEAWASAHRRDSSLSLPCPTHPLSPVRCNALHCDANQRNAMKSNQLNYAMEQHGMKCPDDAFDDHSPHVPWQLYNVYNSMQCTVMQLRWMQWKAIVYNAPAWNVKMLPL